MYINRSTRREFLESLRNENSEVRIMPIFRWEKWNLPHFSFWWICRVEISLDRQLWSEEFLCIFEVFSMNWLRRWTWRWLIVWCVSGCLFPRRFQSILLLLETNSNIRQRNISKTSKVKRKVFELTFEEKKTIFWQIFFAMLRMLLLITKNILSWHSPGGIVMIEWFYLDYYHIYIRKNSISTIVDWQTFVLDDDHEEQIRHFSSCSFACQPTTLDKKNWSRWRKLRWLISLRTNFLKFKKKTHRKRKEKEHLSSKCLSIILILRRTDGIFISLAHNNNQRRKFVRQTNSLLLLFFSPRHPFEVIRWQGNTLESLFSTYKTRQQQQQHSSNCLLLFSIYTRCDLSK